MAVRKKTTGKKSAAKKTARKKAPKRKASAGKKKAAGKKKTKAGFAERTRKAIDKNLRDLERELPKHLKALIRDVRRGVKELEDQIEKARADGEARWSELEKQVRRDSDKMLKRFGIGKGKKKAAKSKKTRR